MKHRILLFTAYALLLTRLPAVAADVWTIAVLGDTQEYVNGPNNAAGAELAAGFTAQTDWIVDRAAAENIVFVSQVGDIVSEGFVPLQWQRADDAMSRLDSLPALPWSTNAGNHDLDQPDSLASGFDEYLTHFGPQRHVDKTWFGGSDLGVAGGLGLNTYQRFSGGEREYLHLSLEYDAPDSAIAWAESVLADHPEMPTLITTHTLLRDERPGAFGHGGPLARTPAPYTAGPGRNSGEQIWDKLIREHPQIFLTLNGHYCCERQLTSLNDDDLEVFQFQVDYSREPNGGDGWIRLLRFDEAADEIRIQTYTPGVPLNPNARFDTDSASQFTLPLDWGVRFDGEPRPPVEPEPSDPPGVFFFQQDRSGYRGTQATWFSERSSERAGFPNQHFFRTAQWPAANQQGLLRFDDLFGDEEGQVALGSTIESATLTLLVPDDITYSDGEAFAVHQMLVPWEVTDGWNAEPWAGGATRQIDLDGQEAAIKPVTDATAFATENGALNGGLPETRILYGTTLELDVTSLVAAWLDGAPNYGFLLQSLGQDAGNGLFMAGTYYLSNSGDTTGRPLLTIRTQIVPEPSSLVHLLVVLGGVVVCLKRRLAFDWKYTC